MEAPAPAAPPRGFGPLLADRRFLPYFASVSAGGAGYAVYAVLIPWLAYGIGGPIAVGLVLFAEFAIYSLSFATGPLLDRVPDLRGVLVVAYAMQGVLSALLGVLALDHLLTVPLLLGIVVPLSAFWDFAWTGTNVALPRLVGPGEVLRANGLLGAAGGLIDLAGYSVGAGILLLGGPATGMFLYAALNGVAALASIAVRAPAPAAPIARFSAAFREGWAYLLGDPGRPRLQLCVVSGVQAFASAVPVLLLTALAGRSNAPGAYAIAFTVFAFGGILGSFLLGQRSPSRHLGLWLAGCAGLEGALLIAATASFGLGPAGAAPWLAVGAADAAFYALVFSYFQATSPPRLVARSITNAYLFRGISRAVGGLVFAAALAGTAPLLLAGAVAVLFAASATGAAGLPAVRRMRL